MNLCKMQKAVYQNKKEKGFNTFDVNLYNEKREYEAVNEKSEHCLPQEKCEWCNLKENDRKWLLFETASWSIYLSDIQDYIGRCILVLNRHCESLSELSMSEWIELKEIIDRLEHCYTSILGADLCNWSCLMNDFYKKAEPNPHVHIHVRPRYKQPIIIKNKAYEDTEYGHHYALKKTVLLSDEDRVMLYELMKRNLN